MKTVISTAGLLAAASVCTHAADMSNVLPQAKPGECYARVLIPETYETQTSTVIVREAAEHVSIVPAKYEWETQRVLVSEASVQLDVIPASYETITQEIEIAAAQAKWVVGSVHSSIEASPGILSVAQQAGVPVTTAQSGQCYEEYFETPAYETVTRRVQISEASTVVEVIPARYEWTEHHQMVAPQSPKLVEVPAVYEMVTEQVKVEDAKVAWKQGRGAVEKLDKFTGDIMCLVEVPVVYKTVEKTVLKTPATTRQVAGPARYESVQVRRMIEPAQHVRKEIPARYRTVEIDKKVSAARHFWQATSYQDIPEGVRKTGIVICWKVTPARTEFINKVVVASPASVKEVDIPARYQNKRVRRLLAAPLESKIQIPAITRQISDRVQVSEPRLEWRPVLCKTNTTKKTILAAQQALADAGYSVGEIDGVLSHKTLSAVEQFQKARKLATGGLTLEVLDSLGVGPGW